MPEADANTKKTTKLAANANRREVERFNAACAAVKMDPGNTLRLLAEAFIEHVDKHGKVLWPIELVPPKR